MNTLFRMNTISKLFATALAAMTCGAVSAQTGVLNLYSARHYSTDEALYSNFTKQTGIKINRIEAGEDALLARIESEGDKSPADVFLTVDAGRLATAEQKGIFAPVNSAILNAQIPAHLRMASNTWFGFSTRARLIVVDKAKVPVGAVKTYADLADPKWKGQICTRSGSHVYQLSLLSAMIEHEGAAKAEAWAKGVAANLARTPRGGDTDQIKAVAAGECAIALANSYYYGRLLNSAKPDEIAIIEKTRVIFADQEGNGTHINVSGGGVLKYAPNKANAIKFLEYLASDQAQAYFADGNNEWPVTKTAKMTNAKLEALGTFKQDQINMAALGKNQALAQEIVVRVGWK
jgi:iron(III) transport system substrate-binding protein